MTPKTGTIRVLIVDDHEMVRIGLRTILTGAGGIAVVGEAGSAAEAVAAVASHRPEVVLMDVRLPDGSGIEACREIRAAHPEVRVLILTSYADDEAVMSAILAGASGYLLKQAKAQALVDAITTIRGGGSLLDPLVTLRIMERIRAQALHPEPDDPLASLSEQERRVLALIAEGRTNHEIAAALVLSENTVKTYVSDLLAKLSLRRRSEAAAFFARHRGPRSD